MNLCPIRVFFHKVFGCYNSFQIIALRETVHSGEVTCRTLYPHQCQGSHALAQHCQHEEPRKFRDIMRKILPLLHL